MGIAEIEEKIRRTAKNTDEVIVKLDTLCARIDTAAANQNRDLVEYYQRAFAEASVEFIDGVEIILDAWYSLRGEKRPPANEENLSPSDLDSIHDAVVKIVQRVPYEQEQAQPEPSDLHPRRKDPDNRLDLRG